MRFKTFIYVGSLAGTLLFGPVACTDLEIEETDSIISDERADGFTPLDNPASALGDLYNEVGNNFGTQENMYAMSQVTTDELVVPTRGTDWGDNGIWRQLHTHTWRPDHLFILNAWNDLNENVFRASEIIESNPEARVAAEAKFLRAFNMFFLMDLFGIAPFREVDEGPDIDPRVLSRPEVFAFVENDLNEARPGLPDGARGVEATGKASKSSVDFLLAKMYLNAHIYKGTAAPDNADLQRVVTLVDGIETAGFAIQGDGYFKIFEPTEDSETIFWTKSDVGARIWNGLHYNQNSPDQLEGGWNGFSTLSEFYDVFEGPSDRNYQGDGQEERRGWVPDASNANDSNLGIGLGFLINQQYDENGVALNNRQGRPLKYTRDIPSLVGNGEEIGIRVIKYHPFDSTDAMDQINSRRLHQILFRFSDAHLMRAEAMMRMGQDITAAVNRLRQSRANTSNLISVDENTLLEERGRELYVEYWRRNDLVRFGRFTASWGLKEVADQDHLNLFPIPETALLSNPNLMQNPGY